MEKRYEKKVLEKGTTIYGDHTNPPIPEGYWYCRGKWNNGYTIRKGFLDEFIWVPIGALEKNGVFKGKLEKFGRRPNLDKPFDESGYYEENSQELEEQFEMIKKYGGIYISRYVISKDVSGRAQSQRREIPWVNISIVKAREVIKETFETEKVGAGVVTASLYDSILELLIELGVKTTDEIVKDSSNWGNFAELPYVKDSKPKLEMTGMHPEYDVIGIADLAGNVGELTLESNTFTKTKATVRGGGYGHCGDYANVAFRSQVSPSGHSAVGFRAVLLVK